ncbi:MAG: sigma-70 family RNA polymerase sigma factor [Chloroflexi bacterium]|nr:sigma-70 family RNA polymerase sigma factor [Chloroflexota bacterium]
MREKDGASGEPDRAAGDRSLLARIGQRDQAAFAELYDRYADGIFGTAVRFLRDRSMAAEVVQDTFMAVWQRGEQFHAGSGSVIGWMLGIARNRAIDRLRAEARRPLAEWVRPGQVSSVDDNPDRGRPGHSSGSHSDDPAAEADRRWLRAVIQTVLGELRSDEREILVLAYDHALSQGEIANRLGIPIGTVKSRTRRALARLRLRLEGVPDLRDQASSVSAIPLRGDDR